MGGIDGWTAFDSEKEYMISGWTAFSRVTGTKERMLDLQQGWPHYFERPDASHLSIDSSATSMNGFAGRYTLNKQKGRLMLNAAFGFMSPGFESGDLGYLSRTDVVNYHIGTGYKWNDPTQYYRYIKIFGSYFSTLISAEMLFGAESGEESNYQLPNYHTFELYYDYGFESVNNQQTRGGPLMLNLPGYEYGLNFYTDSRNDYIEEAYWYAYEGQRWILS